MSARDSIRHAKKVYMTNSAPQTNTCPRCGAAFTCGMNAGQEPCWCTILPLLSTPLPDAGCYCPACLKQLIEAQSEQAALS